MDISMNTIEYLISPSVYKKLSEKTHDNSLKLLKQDMKFYKKRIYQHTKDLLRNNNINKEIDNSFYNYVRILIEHLKFIDTSDIIQEDYKNMNNKKVKFSIITKQDERNPDEIIMKQPEIKSCKIEDCMNIIINKKETPRILPKKKNINLKDPNLRTKGLKNKKS